MIKSEIIINQIKVPTLGLGTYKLTGTAGRKSIEDAIHMGYRHLDTAQYYDNEKEVGDAIMNSGIAREEIFVTTKVWPSNFKKLIYTVEESLRKLRSDYVDLLLLHWPLDDETNKIGVEHLNTALKKGYTKNIGVSNFTIPQLKKALAEAPIINNQVEYHPFISQEKMLEFLKENNMFLTAYSPLALGKVSSNHTLKRIGEKYGKTASQVGLRWLIQQGNVSVIPRSSSEERRRENAGIFDFELSLSDMEVIERLGLKIKQ